MMRDILQEDGRQSFLEERDLRRLLKLYFEFYEIKTDGEDVRRRQDEYRRKFEAKSESLRTLFEGQNQQENPPGRGWASSVFLNI